MKTEWEKGRWKGNENERRIEDEGSKQVNNTGIRNTAKKTHENRHYIGCEMYPR